VTPKVLVTQATFGPTLAPSRSRRRPAGRARPGVRTSMGTMTVEQFKALVHVDSDTEAALRPRPTACQIKLTRTMTRTISATASCDTSLALAGGAHPLSTRARGIRRRNQPQGFKARLEGTAAPEKARSTASLRFRVNARHGSHECSGASVRSWWRGAHSLLPNTAVAR
jgi:hypothetical protein